MGKKKPAKIPLISAITISVLALIVFIYQTQIFLNPVVPVTISLFLLFPYQKQSRFVKRLVLLIALLLVLWILSDLGFALIPFIISFLIAYIFEPLVRFLTKRNIHRWAAALSIMILFIGAVVIIGIFVFPQIFSQLNDAIRKISELVSNFSKELDSDYILNFFTGLGIPEETVRNTVEQEIIPNIQLFFKQILQALLNLITRVSDIATQIFNIIIIPVLSFYLLKDFDKLETAIKSLVKAKDPKLLHNLRRINNIFRKYIGWQILAAFIVGTSCSIFFTIFGVPYPVILGVICGFLNPIPYLGIFSSLVICVLTIIIVNPVNIVGALITVIVIISVLHFINAYFLEPNIAGKMIGLHPVLLIASLFIFGGLFGFIGLLIAVPCTGVLMMFFNDWREKITSTDKAEVI